MKPSRCLVRRELAFPPRADTRRVNEAYLKPARLVSRSTAVIGWRGNAPVIAAECEGDRLRFWCDTCAVFHVHGLGDGHRIAQCKPGSPFAATGYYLRGYTPDPRAA